jgi:sulfur carrier protein
MSSEQTIQVNGETETLSAPTTLASLLAEKGIEAQARGVAVALNGRLVQKAAWTETEVSPGATIEIVQAKQGG